MNRYKKGEYGYLKAYRREKLIASVIFAAMIEFIVITLLLKFGTTKNIMIVIAVLLSLPFAKFLIAFLVCIKFKPLSQEEYGKIAEACKDEAGRMLFDLGISQYEGMRFFPVVCVKNNGIYALVSDREFEEKKKDYEKWLLGCTGEKSKCIVRVFSDADSFIKKINSVSTPKDAAGRSDKNIADQLLEHSI